LRNEDNILYLDTNVYIAYYFGRNNTLRHNDRDTINNEISQFHRSNSYFTPSNQIFVPTLLAIEIFSTIRKILSRSPSINNKDILNEESKKLFQNIIKDIGQQRNFLFDQKTNTNQINMNSVVRKSYDIISTIKGNLKKNNFCNTCRTRRIQQQVHKCLDMMDIMHILMAKSYGCKKFITFDKGFIEIMNHKEIEPVIIEIPQ
jgi:predicted nucleic acid-binding protein